MQKKDIVDKIESYLMDMKLLHKALVICGSYLPIVFLFILSYQRNTGDFSTLKLKALLGLPTGFNLAPIALFLLGVPMWISRASVDPGKWEFDSFTANRFKP